MKGYIQTCIAHSRHPVRSFRQLGFLAFLRGHDGDFGNGAERTLLSLLHRLRGGDSVDGPINGCVATGHVALQRDAVSAWLSGDLCARFCRADAAALVGSASVDAVAAALLSSCQLGCVAGCVGTEPGSVPVEQDLSRPRANYTAITASETPRKSPQNHIVEDRSAVTPPQDSTRSYQAGDRADDQRAPKSRSDVWRSLQPRARTHFELLSQTK